MGTNENTKAQKYLMGGIEKTIETHKDVLLPKVAHILKSFYDEDIIDEEVILEWGKRLRKKVMRKMIAMVPLIWNLTKEPKFLPSKKLRKIKMAKILLQPPRMMTTTMMKMRLILMISNKRKKNNS